MAAIHQQKREARRQIIEDLTAHYRALPRKDLEKVAVSLARVAALNLSLLSLRDLRDWQDSIRDARCNE